MNTDFEKIREIFFSIVAQPSAQWEALADEACGNDPDLRQQLAALLKAHAEGEGILDRDPPGQNATGVHESHNERPGTVIGPYKLLQQIGEGGMGVVFMAEQEKPVRRKVALKVIKAGMDSRQVIARFEAERQALAMMDHANIARVLDAGATESGGPYFVMELVHGVPITKYCDDNRLTPRERLELFVPVCQAIQHAHQKGIIHRDIKPSNVLVTMYDGKPVPKVIDFGVAKATEQRLTERTLFTQYGTIIGTFEYMSPEQAEMSAQGVDTRSDIYSLGALLYELLTGSTPLSHQRLREAAYGEILRMIKEEEPPRPSTRLSDSGAGIASISAQRQMEPAKLTKLLRGELDWIVMKTLEKDRNRRYETADAFVADLQRYLSDEPVQACPPSAAYRLRKFARRYRAALWTTGVVALALVVGTIVSAWQAVRATRAEGLADFRLEAERRARQDADANLQTARKAVDDYFNIVSGSPLLETPGLEPLRKQLLETALGYNRDFIQQHSEDPSLQADVAAAHIRVAEIVYLVGESGNEWFPHLREAVGIISRLIDEHRDSPEVQRRLAKIHLIIGPPSGGPGASGDVLACIQQLAKNFEKLIQDNPNEPEFQRTLAGAYYYLVLGPFVESDRVRWNDKAVEIWEKLTREHPTVASYRMDLARALEQRAGMRFSGREQQADQAAQKALLLRQELAREFPARSTNNVWLAASYRTMAEVQVARNDHKAAEKTLRDALKLQQILVLNSPAVPAYQEELAKTEQELAGALTKLRRPQEAAEACRLALETSGRLVASFPKVTTYRVMHLQAARNLAQVLQSVGRGNEGTLVIRRAIGVYQTLKESAAGSAGDRLALAESFKSFATFLEEIGEQEEAERAARKVIEIYETLMTDFPNVPDYPSALGVFVHNMPSNGAKQADMPERYERAIRYQQIALKMAPGDTRYRTHFGNHYLGLANALMWVGEHAKAKEAYDQAIVIKQKLAADFPNDAQYRESLAQGNLTIATDLMVFDRLKDAEQPARQALELFEKLAADFPTAPAYQESFVKCRFQISLLAGRLGRTQEALQGYRRVIELSPKNAPAHDNLARMLATCPDPRFRDSAKAVEHAKKAVELAAKEGVFWNTLGVAHYRAGDWKATIGAIEKSMQLRNGGDSFDWFFLAMAHWQLGDKEQARKWYDQAVEWTEKNYPKHDTLRRFRTEAAAVLGVNEKKD